VADSPLGSRKTRRLIAAGKLEASRVGRRLYVRVTDVDRFLEARTVDRPKPTPVPVASGDPAEYARRNLHLLTGGS
jgi:excisionase family DNA binding protein